jgi:nitrogen fixation protein
MVYVPIGSLSGEIVGVGAQQDQIGGHILLIRGIRNTYKFLVRKA